MLSSQQLGAKQNEQVVELSLDLIERGFYQPRELFEPAVMEATRLSIQEKGQKYPVVVREIQPGNPLFKPEWPETHYELADGERRTRCCRELGYKTIKAIVRDLSDEEMLDYTVTTTDAVPLNPIEKAKVFQRLAKEFNKSQAEIAKSFNLKQQQVSEYIRLLELPQKIQDLTARSVISMRHAREILKVEDPQARLKLCEQIIHAKLSTRELSKQVKEIQGKKREVKHDKISEEDLVFSQQASNPVHASNSLSEAMEEIIVEKGLPNPKPTAQFELPVPPSPKKDFFLVEFFSQINALILVGAPKKWLQSYLNQRQHLKEARPEKYLAWLQVSLLFPPLVIFAIYRFSPFVALAFGCVGCAILLLKLFEEGFRP